MITRRLPRAATRQGDSATAAILAERLQTSIYIYDAHFLEPKVMNKFGAGLYSIDRESTVSFLMEDVIGLDYSVLPVRTGSEVAAQDGGQEGVLGTGG